MTNRRCWRRINKPKFDYELKGRCDPVVGVAILFSVYAPEGCERLYRICANLPYYAHMNTYSDPPMALADAKKMARAWVKANERPNAEIRPLDAASSRPVAPGLTG